MRRRSEDDAATLDDLREAVTTLEDAERIARRVLGGAHPTAMQTGAASAPSAPAKRRRRNASTFHTTHQPRRYKTPCPFGREISASSAPRASIASK